ncbi:MAG TPA: asparagine synthase (glutamine-hydrolyzing) [Dehalococcoidia bacterium]|nr:asparagine synthase (glutamine-hydrolyzing) [Dehalococcoidia bacterium]
MCGIAGFLGANARSVGALATLRCMTDSIAHRGPDDDGHWLDTVAGVALGHRRLSILDLSEAGHQPMQCACGRHVVSYNGEIYNHQTIACDLAAGGTCFRGHSDTEVLVEAICAWGMQATLERIEGMFAIAHWDAELHMLHLARDRAGIKPLYYGWAGETFLFASELKALKNHPDFRPKVDRRALTLYFRLEYVPPPLSVYEGVSKLAPGTWLEVKCERGRFEASPPRPYWSLEEVAFEGVYRPLDLPDWAATTKLESLIRQSVTRQRVADVPVGAFLSGGIDSSAVVAVMQSVSDEPVRTFSIGFRDQQYDEAPWAKQIAQHLGTQHSELYVTPHELLETITDLPALYDEPFAEPSQLPTFLLASMARKGVKVAMSGDGGDELFGGYAWYDRFRQLWSANRWLPAPARHLASRLLHNESVMQPKASRWPLLADALATKPHKLAAVLEAEEPRNLYLELRSEWPFADDLVLGAKPQACTVFTDGSAVLQGQDVRLLAMYLDMCTFLPEHPLTKVDRATMAVGLEARVPLLDRDIIEFVWRLPLHQRIRKNTTKYLLREVLYRYVPPHMVDRPKVGFAVPIADWLRGPLRSWAEPLVDLDRIRCEGYLDPERVQRVWREHQSGERDWHRALWSVLVFESWLETVKP